MFITLLIVAVPVAVIASALRAVADALRASEQYQMIMDEASESSMQAASNAK